jgi:hypothetical protein
MSTRIAVITTFLVALAVVPGRVNSGLTAQTPPATSSGQQAAPTMQDMTKMHEQMMAQMQAGDARLDALVKDMNAAKGEAKVDAVAAVVTELVTQQKAMHGHMGQMHQMMMMGGRGMMMKK